MKPVEQKKLFIIDGSSFLYRAYYGLKPLHTNQGVPVQAVYGFCRMIKKLIDKEVVDHAVLVWDMPGKTVRHTLFEDYKATRQAPPSDLFEQKKLITEFADLITLAQIGMTGYEADDVMHTIAQQAVIQDFNAIIVSSDKDMGQMINDHIWQYDPIKMIYKDKQQFINEYGFEPKKLIFFHALVGDASDNIPGAKGIGIKTAKKLVERFDSIDDMYNNLASISAKLQKILLEEKENILLSYQLFQLHTINHNFKIEDYHYDEKNYTNAHPLFAKLGFTSLLNTTNQEMKKEAHKTIDALISYWQAKSTAITTIKELQLLIEKITEVGSCAIDTETTGGKHPINASLVGFSCAINDIRGYYIPCIKTDENTEISHQTIIQLCKDFLENPRITKYMHNAKYDLNIFANIDIKVQGVAFDTMLMARLLLPEWERINLKTLSENILQEKMLSFDDIMLHTQVTSFEQVPLKLATAYASADALQTYKLYQYFIKALEKPLMDTYQSIEHPTMLVLTAMERQGILVKKEILIDLSYNYQTHMIALEKEIANAAHFIPGALNLNSPKQIEQLLFTTLGLPPQKKSAKKTAYSTDVHVLEKLQRLHPVPALLLKYRELTKLQQTYAEGLQKYINPCSQKIHTNFNQTVVATGRLSSSEPNLQNIPASGIGLKIRTAFVPGNNCLFLSADYSQIELRVLAQLSQDKQLINAFINNLDIHRQTAAGLFDCQTDQVTEEQRQMGKKINFSILYGKTPFGLSEELGISIQTAKTYIDNYFAQYPHVKEWMEQVICLAKEKGYIETLYGRRRHLEHITSKNKYLFNEASRIAVNSVVQGTAADIMKIGMCRIHQQLDPAVGRLILQIHDEIVLEITDACIEQATESIKNILENVARNWSIPLKVAISSGNNWYQVS